MSGPLAKKLRPMQVVLLLLFALILIGVLSSFDRGFPFEFFPDKAQKHRLMLLFGSLVIWLGAVTCADWLLEKVSGKISDDRSD